MWRYPKYLKDLASKQTPEKALPCSISPSHFRHNKRAGIPPAQYIKPYQDKKSSIHKVKSLMNTRYGAADRTWTGTESPPRDFKSLVSAYSTTAAIKLCVNKSVNICYYIQKAVNCQYGIAAFLYFLVSWDKHTFAAIFSIFVIANRRLDSVPLIGSPRRASPERRCQSR